MLTFLPQWAGEFRRDCLGLNPSSSTYFINRGDHIPGLTWTIPDCLLCQNNYSNSPFHSQMGPSHSIYVAAWTNHNFFSLSLFSSEKILKTFEILKYITSIQEISTVIIVFGSVPSVGLWRGMNLLCCSPMAVLKNSCWSPSFIGLSSDNLSISGLG